MPSMRPRSAKTVMPVKFLRCQKVMISNFKHRFLAFFLLTMLLSSIHPHSSHAQVTGPIREPIIIKVVYLDYTDAENLASVLAPLLSKEGRVVAYRPTNALIIKDRASLVRKLVRIIKGPAEPCGDSLDCISGKGREK